MTIIKFIKENKYMTYSILSGLYGFSRSFNGKYQPPHDVLGNRFMCAFANGCLYSLPLYSQYYQIKLLNRIDIKLRGKDPNNYKESYEDMYSVNFNVFI